MTNIDGFEAIDESPALQNTGIFLDRHGHDSLGETGAGHERLEIAVEGASAEQDTVQRQAMHPKATRPRYRTRYSPMPRTSFLAHHPCMPTTHSPVPPSTDASGGTSRYGSLR